MGSGRFCLSLNFTWRGGRVIGGVVAHLSRGHSFFLLYTSLNIYYKSLVKTML